MGFRRSRNCPGGFGSFCKTVTATALRRGHLLKVIKQSRLYEQPTSCSKSKIQLPRLFMTPINQATSLEVSSPLSPSPSDFARRMECPPPTSPLTSPPPSSPPRPNNHYNPVLDVQEDPESVGRLDAEDGVFGARLPRPQSDAEKIRFFLHMLRRWRWTISTLLEKLAQCRDLPKFRLPYREFQDFAYTRVMKSDLRDTISSTQWQGIMDAKGWQLAAQTLDSELQTLTSQSPCFQKYTPIAGSDGSDLTETLSLLRPSIKQHAPRWTYLFDSTTESRSNKASKEPQIVILSLLTHMQQPYKSSYFATVLGLYLYHGGVRRRVLECMAHLGLSRSYKTIHRIMAVASAEQRKQIRIFGRDPATVVAYDNYDFAVGRRGERTGDHREHRSIVTALSFSNQHIPTNGLRQSMWHPEKALSAVDMVRNLRRDNVWLDVRYKRLRLSTLWANRRSRPGFTKSSPQSRRCFKITKTKANFLGRQTCPRSSPSHLIGPSACQCHPS